MFHSTASLTTEHAARYLAQLAKHFAHKIDVVQTEGETELRFSCGTARLSVEGEALIMKAESPTEGELAETQDVVERHLARFAFREEIAPLAWS